MESFVRKHQKKINGTLGCFDRMLFRGYLPIQSRLDDGRISETKSNIIPEPERFSYPQRGQDQSVCESTGGETGPTVSRSDDLYPEGRFSPEDGGKGRDTAGTDLRLFGSATMSDIFIQV